MVMMHPITGINRKYYRSLMSSRIVEIIHTFKIEIVFESTEKIIYDKKFVYDNEKFPTCVSVAKKITTPQESFFKQAKVVQHIDEYGNSTEHRDEMIVDAMHQCEPFINDILKSYKSIYSIEVPKYTIDVCEDLTVPKKFITERDKLCHK